MTRLRRNILFTAAGFALLGLVAAAVVFTALQSQWLRESIRKRIIAETEKATGGRVELGKFDFDWRKLNATAGPFVLHGKEKPGEPAFFRAGSIAVGLKVVSIAKKDVDIASLIVEKPELHILVYPDGTTNIPSPAVRKKDSNVVERFIRLAVQHFELRNGMAQFRDDRLPFDVRGENLNLAFDYDPGGPRYKGHASSRKLHINAKDLSDAAFDFDSDLALERDRLLLTNALFNMGRTQLTVNGNLRDWSALAADLDFAGKVAVPELARVVRLPIERNGEADVDGRAALSWAGGFKMRIQGKANARGLSYRDSRIRVEGVAARTSFILTNDEILLPDVRASALGGSFTGSVSYREPASRLRIEGNASGLGIDQLTRIAAQPSLAWSGTVSGPVRIDGLVGNGPARAFTMQATMNVAPAPGGIPIRGNVDVLYDQRAGALRLGDSALYTGSTQIHVSGTLGQTLRASVRTSNLDELLPAIALAGPNALKQLPVKLAAGGSASADAVVTGPLNSPRVTAKAVASNIEWEGRRFQKASADVTMSASELIARNVDVVHAAGRITGAGRIALANWRVVDASALSGSFALRNGDLKQLVAEASQKVDATGAVRGDAQLAGTAHAPTASFDVTVDRPSGYGENFDQLHVRGSLDTNSVDVASGALTMGKSQLEFAGSYRRTGADWSTGTVTFTAGSGGIVLNQMRHIRDYDSTLAGELRLRAVGEARVRKSDFDLVALDSRISINGMTIGSSTVGNVALTAQTKGDTLHAQLEGAIRGSKVTGSGDWKLTGDYPGRAEVRFTPVTFAALHDIATRGKVESELPFAGSVEGSAVISGSLKKPDSLQAVVSLPKIEMGQNPSKPLPTSARAQDLTIRNTAPVELVATLKDINIRAARFEAKDTNLDASGRITFDSKTPWNVGMRGRVNLAILQLFNPDLLGAGNATADVTVRGALNDPQIAGKLELREASLYLRDITTGIDRVNGLVTFDRNRANIEKMSGEFGGGRVALGGFIGFSSGVLLYRVQGNADQVRIRHSEGVSLTLNAALNLTGTSENGLVSGTVTVLRAGFAPRADIGGLLARTYKPLPAPAAPNEYLRGLSFDVRIESGPSLQFQTSLTRDLQAEAELRLRGNAASPIMLGNISVSQGEVDFLGTKYTVNRGEIRFINPTKVEPVFDVDLETKARGITVNISFSGTLSKLNLAYRSDPPLQTSEIIALLAVGRDPTIAPFAGAQTRSNLLQSGANTLGTAVAAPVSSRLQRFFGVSRLKIDPQLTGVENIPQARLTVEQQVSRDITLTYITNLARTSEQIVRVQWDVNREWSAIATREENGVFGIDFQYRKRFK